jgi:epoxyqueuosine reductase
MNSTETIRKKALELGFSLAGFARAEKLESEGERLRQWLDLGYQATMQWMSRNAGKRADVTALVPGAKSVVSVALNYYTETAHRDAPDVGKVSRYAWGDDYHDIMSGKLKALWSWMEQEFPGIRGRYYVDTGPVMDKVWAQRAGLGWIGKHTNLITKEVGSWVFLGEIITTLELEYDRAETDHCGSCTLCIEACPTGAIVGPYVVDSGKCISYLTIEHRGEIGGFDAEDFRGWVYGCDICQDVCPWNEKFAVVSPEPGFQPREGNRAPLLEAWEKMSDEEFRSRFRGSAIKRTKLDGVRRNAALALRPEQKTAGG